MRSQRVRISHLGENFVVQCFILTWVVRLRIQLLEAKLSTAEILDDVGGQANFLANNSKRCGIVPLVWPELNLDDTAVSHINSLHAVEVDAGYSALRA